MARKLLCNSTVENLDKNHNEKTNSEQPLKVETPTSNFVSIEDVRMNIHQVGKNSVPIIGGSQKVAVELTKGGELKDLSEIANKGKELGQTKNMENGPTPHYRLCLHDEINVDNPEDCWLKLSGLQN